MGKQLLCELAGPVEIQGHRIIPRLFGAGDSYRAALSGVVDEDIHFSQCGQSSLRNALPPTANGGDDDDDDDGTGVQVPDTTSGADLFNVLEPVTGLIGTAQRVPGAGAFAVFKSGDDFQMFLNALQARTSGSYRDGRSY